MAAIQLVFCAVAASAFMGLQKANAGTSDVHRVDVAVDFNVVTGPVKPVNGVGQPPMVGMFASWDLMHYLKEAGIPYSRLHDVGGCLGQGLFVDIPNLFRNFDADENDPANYTFAYTDDLLKVLVKNGVEPFFRLGVTIENFASRLPRVHTNPPKDFAKWARICEHVVAHYNEGWANGFKMNISYWEIWNEPSHLPMWGGTFADYVRLYGTAAHHLKRRFRNIKVGGYAAMTRSGAKDWKATVGKNLDYFLAEVKRNGWPLDFFSYHGYCPMDGTMDRIRHFDETLNANGFTADKTERIFNEWLPYYHRRDLLNTAEQASLVGATLAAMQNGPVDVACIYDARCGTGTYSALFNPDTYRPRKAYYAFLAFNELRKLGKAVSVSGSADEVGGDLWFTAARSADGQKGALLVVNVGKDPLPLPRITGGMKAVRARAVDSAHNFAQVPLSGEIGPQTILLIEAER